MGILSFPGCRSQDDDDNTPPKITFVYPPEYDILEDIETIRVDARDNDGLTHILYIAEGETLLVTAVPPYTLLWNTSAYPDCTTADSYIPLTAVAEDYSGNQGSDVRKFYLNNRGLPPLPAEMDEPSEVTKHSARLSWEKSIDYQFSHYILYRDTSKAVSALSDSLVRYGHPDSTSFVDHGAGVTLWGLDEDTDYYYRVWVYDDVGRGDGSDSAALVHTLLPAPVPLSSSGETKYTARLQWSSNGEDISHFRLHRAMGDSTAIDTAAVPDSLTGLPGTTFAYTDTGLISNTNYYYYIHVIDSAGYTHAYRFNDIIAVRTDSIPSGQLHDPPQQVTKYSASLRWNAIPVQEDSSWVELYRGTGTAVDTSISVYRAANGVSETYNDITLQQGQTYSYQLLHRDSRDNRAWSDTLTLTTFAITDLQDAGLGVQVQEKRELTLGWTAYNYPYEDDFAGYILTRDGVTIFTPSEASENSFTDDELDRSTSYDYVLTLSDTSGASRSFNATGTTRDIYPADIVAIATTEAWEFYLEWQSSTEPAGEFAGYRLLRSDDPDEIFDDSNGDNQADCLAAGNCDQVASVTQQNPTAPDSVHLYTDGDTNLIRLRAYYYVVLTYDNAGEYAAGAIMGDTLLTNPDPVVLSIPDSSITETTINLIWTQASWGSAEADAAGFHSYEVWRNTQDGETPGDENSSYQLHRVLPGDITNTTYPDGISESNRGVSFYYSIVVRDNFGQTSPSNEMEAATPP